MKPFRLDVKGHCVASAEKLRQNAEQNASVPRVQFCAPHKRRLAIAGGGPSLVNDLEELRAWDGDIWAINDTAQWLNERGVHATLFSVDPMPMDVEAPSAILASLCDPAIFLRMKGRVLAFDMVETHPEGIGGGCFSSTRAPALSLKMGYIDVSFFGCEGSFEERDHVDRHSNHPEQVIVRAGGRDYLTYPSFIVQCEELAKLFYFDNVYHNRSGGLLKAIVEHPDTWEIVGVSPAMKLHLEELNGHQGLYETPYIAAGA